MGLIEFEKISGPAKSKVLDGKFKFTTQWPLEIIRVLRAAKYEKSGNWEILYQLMEFLNEMPMGTQMIYIENSPSFLFLTKNRIKFPADKIERNATNPLSTRRENVDNFRKYGNAELHSELLEFLRYLEREALLS